MRKQRGSLRRLPPEMVVVCMPDYKEMYLTLIKATEDAINLLVKAQRECEEIYISTSEPEDPETES